MALSINLAENPVLDTSHDVMMNLTPYITSWRHTTRAIGGNWHAEGEFVGDPGEKESFFLQHLGKRVFVRDGGHDYWEGQIVRMELTRGGQTFVRSMEDMTNTVKLIYSKIGDNMLVNGNVESGSWTPVGTPASCETASTWFTSGSLSMFCEIDAQSEGMQVGSAMLASGVAYDCSVLTNVASGKWELRLSSSAADVISSRKTTACGRLWLQCQVGQDNLHQAASVRLISNRSGNELNADNAILRTPPVRSETKWWVDSDSASSYGQMEAVYLEREMTDDEADGYAQRKLSENAWPRTRPEIKGATLTGDEVPDDGLIITCRGLVWTLTWRHALTDGTSDADSQLKALLDESEFLTSGTASIDTNTADVYIERGNPMTLWREIEKILKRADDNGNSWTGGGYPWFIFRYSQRPTGTQYQYVNGNMEYYGGGDIPPLEFAPGWCLMIDMPVEPIPAGAADDDDPRRVWIEETEFVYEDGMTHIEWSREEDEL